MDVKPGLEVAGMAEAGVVEVERDAAAVGGPAGQEGVHRAAVLGGEGEAAGELQAEAHAFLGGAFGQALPGEVLPREFLEDRAQARDVRSEYDHVAGIAVRHAGADDVRLEPPGGVIVDEGDFRNLGGQHDGVAAGELLQDRLRERDDEAARDGGEVHRRVVLERFAVLPGQLGDDGEVGGGGRGGRERGEGHRGDRAVVHRVGEAGLDGVQAGLGVQLPENAGAAGCVGGDLDPHIRVVRRGFEQAVGGLAALDRGPGLEGDADALDRGTVLVLDDDFDRAGQDGAEIALLAGALAHAQRVVGWLEAGAEGVESLAHVRDVLRLGVGAVRRIVAHVAGVEAGQDREGQAALVGRGEGGEGDAVAVAFA